MTTKATELPLYRKVDPADPDVPKGSAWFYVEVRPAAVGSGYQIENRSRVISWVRTRNGQVRPRLATGVVEDARAWSNSDPDRLLAGSSFVECQQRDGHRLFWNPHAKELLDSAGMKKHMARLRAIATDPVENAAFRKLVTKAATQ